LLREGCEGAFDKSSVEDLELLIGTIEAHFAVADPGGATVRGLGDTVRAISGLLHEWNLRLEKNGRAHTQGVDDG
jgi:hypothetical protein